VSSLTDLLPFPIPSLTKVLGGALVGSLLLSGVLGGLLAWKGHELNNAKEVIQRLEGWQGGIVQSIRLATGNNAVTKDTAQNQVQAMGNSLVALNNALKTSNDAVERLGEEKRAAEQAAAREAKARAAAIATAEKLSAQMKAGAAKPVSQADIEKEIRRTQDELYEAGQ
jgi:cysteinyl-tRNA synthetase